MQSQLGLIHKIKGLSEYVAEQICHINGRISRVIVMSPPDSVRTTISNAQPDLLNALRVPGMPLQNSGTEQIILDCIAIDRRRV